jgi:DNA repair ATPase RecN
MKTPETCSSRELETLVHNPNLFVRRAALTELVLRKHSQTMEELDECAERVKHLERMKRDLEEIQEQLDEAEYDLGEIVAELEITKERLKQYEPTS